MLTTEEKSEIDIEVAKYEYKQGACLEALTIVQHHRGWVSDESLKEIAVYLEMSPAELDSIATFYNLIFRRPVGKNVIRICDSVSCWIKGYEDIREKIRQHLGIDLGQTTVDNSFTMVPNQCLGCCDHAPALMINDDLYGDLDPQKIGDILEKHQSQVSQTH